MAKTDTLHIRIEPSVKQRAEKTLNDFDENENEYFNSDRGKMRKMATLRSFFKYFYRRGDLKENIMTKIDLPKIHEKSILRLSDDEVTKMIDAASKNPRDKMIISLFLLFK